MRASLRVIATMVYAWILSSISNSNAVPNNNPTTQDKQDRLQNLLSAAPSLRLRIMLERENMEIHGQSVFDVFIKPIVSGTELRYDGFSTFIEGDNKFTYIVENGASYVVETTGVENTSAPTHNVRCYTSGIPFDAVLSSLNNLFEFRNAYINGEPVQCPRGLLFQTSVVNTDFVLCASGTSGLTVYGRDITVEVKYLSSPIRKIALPTRSNNVESCPVVVTPTPMTPTAALLVTGDAIPATTTRNLKPTTPPFHDTDNSNEGELREKNKLAMIFFTPLPVVRQ